MQFGGGICFCVGLALLLGVDAAEAVLSENYEEELRNELFIKRKIDTHTRPVVHHSNVVQLKFGLSVTHIIELNEKTSVLSLNCWIRFMWNDDNFSWKPENYGNISVLRVDPQLIWKPDVVPYNNAKAGDIGVYGETNTLVFSDGQMLWVPPATLHTICDVDVHNYPFDVQHCAIKFGSWTHHGYLVNISLYKETTPDNPDNEIIENLATEHNEWKILDVTQVRKDVFYPCCAEPYPLVKFVLKLQRRAPYYQFTLVLPSILTMMLTLAVFWLPPQAGERIILTCFNTLLQLVLLIHIFWSVPRNGSTVPAIVKFNGCSMMFVALSTILSVISLKVSRTRYLTPVPVVLRNLLSNTIGKLLCLRSSISSMTPDAGLLDMSGSDGGKDNSSGGGGGCKEFSEWLLVATALNRLLFFVYLLIYVLIVCACFF